MAARPGLPTEEEIDQMKPLRLARLLLEFGMTEEETDNMEKDEARAELKRRIRDLRVLAATRRRPGQITEMLQRAMFENRMKRGRLMEICNSILDFVVTMDSDDKQKMSDVFGQDLRVVLEDVWKFLQDDNCPILVVGETSSGKSSLLNLLLGEDILPVSHLASTSTLCYVRHGEVKRATVHLKKGSNSSTAGIDLQDADRAKDELSSYVHRWGNEDATEVQKVVIEWPLESLQDGICLVDGPGIMQTQQMDEVVKGAVSSTCAFIYMINSAIPLKPASSSSGGGERTDEHTDGFSCLLKFCQKRKWGGAFDMSQFDLESTMFVCNKWDSVKQDESEVVKKDYLQKLKDHFPELRDDQVFFLSCHKAVGPAGQPSPEFSRLLDGLDKLLPQSLQHKLELQHQHVWEVLQKASQRIKLKLHSTYGTQTERREAKQDARGRITNFYSHAQDVLQSLDQKLKDTRREAERNLRECLKDEALKDRVYNKILSVYKRDDFPQLTTQGYIGTARLITAIADEIESQLKSNPNSAFNQCNRDADIKLKEEFETRFGALLEQHNNVIEEMLHSPKLPSTFDQLYSIVKETFFKIISVFSRTYALARTIDPTLSSQIWTMVDLAQSLDEILVSPNDREEYISHVTKKAFSAMTKADAIKSAVEKHLKGAIDYLQACKDALPKLKQVDLQILEDVETEKRSAEEIRTIYEPKLETVNQLAEKLCGFYATDIKKHEFDVTIGKPTSWRPHKEGAYGRVYRVQISKDGGTFTAAVKIPRQLPAGETYANFVREAENLRKLKGQHVVKCFGTYKGESCGEGNSVLGLVMEYCPKTLDAEMFERRENSPAWWGADPEKQAAAFSYTKKMAKQLCEGLRTVHGAGYMHRDLKLINILVSSEGVVKLADLGSSKAEKAYARTKEGTPLYMAPEVEKWKVYDKSADIYSLGFILLEMWYGRTIYYPDDPGYESQLTIALPLNVGKELPLPSWRGRAPPIPEWRKLINDCLRRNTEKRPTAENCRDRIAGMSLPPVQTAVAARAASEVRINIQE